MWDLFLGIQRVAGGGFRAAIAILGSLIVASGSGLVMGAGHSTLSHGSLLGRRHRSLLSIGSISRLVLRLVS